MTSHKHLKTVIEDIRANENQLTEDLNLRLIHEVRYSNLYIPAKRDDETLNFIIYEDDDLKLIPLFTDPLEFEKFFKNSTDIELMENSFELYRNILTTTDIDGYILNPASEKYVFLKEFILNITDIPKSNYYTTDTYSLDELLKLKDSENESLEKFIKNPQNVLNHEALFEELSKSVLLTMMVSDEDLKDKAEDGIISMMDSGPLAQMYTDDVGGVYATVFSSEDKIKQVKTDRFKYSQVINLSMLVNYVLSDDLDGIILNPQSDNVLISRQSLLKYSLGFERFANDEKLFSSIFYMFLIE